MSIENKNLLTKMITRETICLNTDAKTWEEAVRISGELLVNAGSAEPRYIDAMIENVKNLGPYIVIAPGVALPHARPEDGVLEPCMSLVTLKEPINFGNSHNNPVKIVISFGTVDKTKHITALKNLARIIGDKGKIEALKKAQDVDSVEAIIRDHIN